MSEETPGGQPPLPPPDIQPRGGSLGLGALVGAVVLYAVYVLGTMAQGPYAWSVTFLAVPAAFIPIVLYLAVAIVLAVRRRTSLWGAGLLIGLGAFVLLGGGLCISFLVQVRA
ncbi:MULTISPECIES: hypothetical protein [Pseudarthrobacter]|uniref:Uncharacterized protein n=1 Tax=Pseudarthrobacter niigatensis TaxID=369935 RepID=A0AAJ1SWZ9_9MICC|nr:MULTISPECIES: hypothetical protein [Pseudarthrobacter]MDQ0146256.1 hypothetical protein [Pseudarthrobacter niigatensis]MDQ0264806.1 hypothetical protein [Pseudarthrobacter niigatensis]QDG64236.1 hypothetical protein NIBR502771_19270 [Pseudarthrobacter sp. NIBRBAC000502771]